MLCKLTRPNPALSLTRDLDYLRHALAIADLELEHAETLRAQADAALQFTKEWIEMYWVDVGLAKGEHGMRARSGYEAKINAEYIQVQIAANSERSKKRRCVEMVGPPPSAFVEAAPPASERPKKKGRGGKKGNNKKANAKARREQARAGLQT
ncbi:hypothetical protein B0H17DRAFT_1213302 [Mycena rosella]|uniref:Uncharacterized protein n=1 Tax=Mycena rosella TaxID=1033263 RepID=A0AAD7CSQ1_MYCRO|nr:hypothetical protein B0H17DRAFT_1213302 [Mycena rosella]